MRTATIFNLNLIKLLFARNQIFNLLIKFFKPAVSTHPFFIQPPISTIFFRFFFEKMKLGKAFANE